MIYIIATEGLSIVENLGKLGVPFPSFVLKALEQLREKADKSPTEKGGAIGEQQQ